MESVAIRMVSIEEIDMVEDRFLRHRRNGALSGRTRKLFGVVAASGDRPQLSIELTIGHFTAAINPERIRIYANEALSYTWSVIACS